MIFYYSTKIFLMWLFKMKIKNLLYKIKNSENTLSNLERNIIIDNNLKEIFIEKISEENKKHINENNLILKMDSTKKKIKFLDFIEAPMDLLNSFAVGLFITYLFFHFSPIGHDSTTYNLLISSLTLFFITLPFSIKKYKRIKKGNFNSYDPNNLSSYQYMNKHYKENIKKSYLDLVKELDSINDHELEKSKSYLNDYISFKILEHIENKENNIFDQIYNKVKENIFISDSPLNSKKLLSEEINIYKQEKHFKIEHKES